MIYPQCSPLIAAAMMVQCTEELDDWLVDQRVLVQFSSSGAVLFFQLDFGHGMRLGPAGSRLDISPQGGRILVKNRTEGYIRTKRRGHAILLEMEHMASEELSWVYLQSMPKHSIRWARAMLMIVRIGTSPSVLNGQSFLNWVPGSPCVALHDQALDRRRNLSVATISTDSRATIPFEATATSSPALFHFAESGYSASGTYIPEDTQKQAAQEYTSRPDKFKHRAHKPRRGFDPRPQKRRP